GCAKSEQNPPPAPPPPAIAAIPNAPVLDTAGMTRTPTGLMYQDLVVGTGPVARAGMNVAVHYAGTLTNGTQFDANGPNDRPYSFLLGAHAVVDGFDQGITGMRVGGKRRVVIPPALGYGANGGGPIPP